MVPRLRSLSHFEFTVVYGVRAHPKFIDLHENVQLFRFIDSRIELKIYWDEKKGVYKSESVRYNAKEL